MQDIIHHNDQHGEPIIIVLDIHINSCDINYDRGATFVARRKTDGESSYN